MDEVPEGMVELWTIEKPTIVRSGRLGVLIDDIMETEDEAIAEIAKRGRPWSTRRIVVPYGKSDADS